MKEVMDMIKSKVMESILDVVKDEAWKECNELVKDMYTTIVFVDKPSIREQSEMLSTIYDSAELDSDCINFMDYVDYMTEDVKYHLQYTGGQEYPLFYLPVYLMIKNMA